MNTLWTLNVAMRGYDVGHTFRLKRITAAGWLMIDRDGNESMFYNVDVFDAA